MQLWYGCKYDTCRNHFQVLKLARWPNQPTSEWTTSIVAESPRVVNMDTRINKSDGAMVHMGCPSCGRYGTVKRTLTRTDGVWRIHACPTCGNYHSCTTDEGVTVHRKMKSLKAIDLFGEAAE
jgi:predicted RNA-binding Zn-ribbon protein involved in translation (DUF1610 family)